MLSDLNQHISRVRGPAPSKEQHVLFLLPGMCFCRLQDVVHNDIPVPDLSVVGLTQFFQPRSALVECPAWVHNVREAVVRWDAERENRQR